MIDIDALIDSLKGTCGSIGDYVEDENELTATDYQRIDNEIFCCETCGWWCENSEMSDTDMVCVDCSDDE